MSNGKLFKLISAISFAAAAFIEFIFLIVMSIRYGSWGIHFGAGFYLYQIVTVLVLAGVAVMIFLDINKLAVLISFGVFALWAIILAIRSPVKHIALFLALLMIGFYVFIAYKPDLIRLPATFARLLKRIFWFIPAAFFFMFVIIAWATRYIDFYSVASDILITGGLCLAGMWFASLIPEKTADRVPPTPVGSGSGTDFWKSPSNDPSGDNWTCPECGCEDNPGKFCMNCGLPKPVIPEPEPVPEDDGKWVCPTCGSAGNPGNFCMKCGTPRPAGTKPAGDGTWTCSQCGRSGNTGKFCGSCGAMKS